MAALLAAGCAAGRSTAPAPAGAAPAPATAPARAAAAAPAPAVAPAPAPAAAPAPAPAATPQLLLDLARAQWRLSALPGLPAEEAHYQAPVEAPNFVEHAYDGGNLRLFTGPGDDAVFAVLVHTGSARYAAFQQAAGSEHYLVVPGDRYVVVCRQAPVDANTFAGVVAARFGSAEAMVRALGQPSYVMHLHGQGDTVYTWLPQGLSFQGGPSFRFVLDPAADPSAPAATPTYEEYRRLLPQRLTAFAQQRQQEAAQITDALARGKASPDGKARAGLLAQGAYWLNWIVVQRPGQAERRRHADYFVLDYAWLDNQRVVYGLQTYTATYTFYIWNTVTGEQKQQAVGAEVKAFGVSAPGRLWYETPQGGRYEFDLPA